MFDVSITHTLGAFTLDARFQAPGGVTALFGRSGSGKSSIVNAIAGLITPSAGRIVVGDTVLFDARRGVNLPPARRRLGMVFQDARLFPHLSVRRNLLYGARFAPRDQPVLATLDEVVDLLGLPDLLDRQPRALSGGEKSRVAIGRALLSNPRALLMDEPLAALDAPRRSEILTYLERLRDRLAVPILYVSHSVPEVARLAQTIALIDAGRVTVSGPLDQVMADPLAAPVFGPREMGALLSAQVAEHTADGLSRCDAAGGTIWLPRVQAAPGERFRLRVLAQDVMLSMTAPQGISALNILPGTIRAIHAGDGPGVLVTLDCAGQVLLARITARSRDQLALHPGQRVHAVLKAVSVPRENIG